MKDCLFCRIVSGDLPSERILETPDILAFLDIGPIVKGHVLVIPKVHAETLHDLPAASLGPWMEAAQRVAEAQVRAWNADGVNLHQANGAAAGQVIPHVHFHVVPRFANDGHHWNWRPKKYDTPAEMNALAERLRSAL